MSKLVSEVMRNNLFRDAHDYTNNIVGKVLTILEMVCDNETRLKAAKDLASQWMWSQYHDFSCNINFFCDCLAEKLNEKKTEPSLGITRKNTIFFEDTTN